MSKRFNVNENIEKLYIEIPKALIYEPKYRKQEDHKGLSNEAKLLYGILLDKTYLSIFKAREEGNKNFIDENGDAFIYFDNASIEYVLQISNKKAIQVKKELVKFNLLEEVQQGLGFTNRLYLNTVDVDHDKLIQYVDDISAASKATNTVRKLKLKKWREEQSLKCKKYTTVENTDVQEVHSAEPIGNALKCKNDITEMYNLHISNTEVSNTDISMYVCTDEPTETELELLKRKFEEENYKMLTLVRKHNLAITDFFEGFLKSLEDEGFDYELFEQVLYCAINKRVNNLEGYVFRTIRNLKAKGITNRYEYDLDVEMYVAKNFRNGRLILNRDSDKSYRNNNNNTRNTKAPAKPKQPETTEVPEVKDVFSPKERYQCLELRNKYNLKDSKYFDMNLEQLKAVIAEREEKFKQVEVIMENYNKDMFDEETRRKFAMRELGLD